MPIAPGTHEPTPPRPRFVHIIMDYIAAALRTAVHVATAPWTVRVVPGHEYSNPAAVLKTYDKTGVAFLRFLWRKRSTPLRS